LMEHFKSSIEEKNVEIAKLQSDNSTLKVNLLDFIGLLLKARIY
jgi:hypothetical protein